MDTNTDTPTSTFTFPSGTTVELPAGMSHCLKPETVTYDVGRYIPVGTTESGRVVLSSYSCAAYTRAAHIHDMQQADAKMHARAQALEARGLTIKAANLRAELTRREQQHSWAVREWTGDPAPCTCK
jgi:hypothetical protein